MAQTHTYSYDKNLFFLFFGITELILAAALIAPFALCPCSLNMQWFRFWWFLYVFPMGMSLILITVGLSQILFWVNHVRKKAYLTVEDGFLKIDAETDIALDDIAAVHLQKFLGCALLCLKVTSPEKYKFSWRFKADRLFHKEYRAFICPDLIKRDQRQECLDWFFERYPTE